MNRGIKFFIRSQGGDVVPIPRDVGVTAARRLCGMSLMHDGSHAACTQSRLAACKDLIIT